MLRLAYESLLEQLLMVVRDEILLQFLMVVRVLKLNVSDHLEQLLIQIEHDLFGDDLVGDDLIGHGNELVEHGDDLVEHGNELLGDDLVECVCDYF